ncbi:MAG: aromatic ring-hydroxylating dioxygenase subunit alpha [Stenomitos rutilans HA7619-LM2]|nr:aromatic ring-hydroxylating dioxygenase subunit alpha [Stenomitos rutilans HA7619-LM2]
MELATDLNSQVLKVGVHEVGINGNCWYAVGWADQLKSGEVMPVTIWHQAIAVYRDASGQLHALEDACPHKGVALHKGKVQGDLLACRYHGWEFNGDGQCVNIPYLPEGQKLPCAQVKYYPVQAKYNLIWLFPGDRTLAKTKALPEIPEFDDPDWLMVPSTAYFQAHFSFCNENSVDLFHGFLHEHQQGWFDPVLTRLQETESTVKAEFQVSYKGRLAKFLGLSAHANQVATQPVVVEYQYPHFSCKLQTMSSNYMMRLPVSATESRSFVFFFFKLRLPHWVLKPLEPALRVLLRRLLILQFLAQDVEMVESEQLNYLKDPEWRRVEINPAVFAVQRLMVRQYMQFIEAQTVHSSSIASTHSTKGSSSKKQSPTAIGVSSDAVRS